jgi:predicted NBD/HSP70 family sugar kinase
VAKREALRQADLREHNLVLLLREVAQAPAPPSRADLATYTSLTRATVSALVDDMIHGGLLVETAPRPRPGAGRPSVGLALSGSGPAGLGLEINVDYLAASIVDLSRAVRHHQVIRADQRDRPPAEAFADLERLTLDATSAATRDGLQLVGATLGVPGLTQPGLVRLAPNLGWRDVTVPSHFGGLAIQVDNEANLAAIAQLVSLSEAPDSFVYISGEIGIGAAIVSDRRVVRGARGFSGEIGHVPISPDGPLCRCGARGCLEQYAGQDAIRDEAGRRLPDGARATDFAALAEAGNLPMLTALERAGWALGIAISSVANLIDVETVVLGGFLAPLTPWLIPAMEQEIATRVLALPWAPLTLAASTLGADAAVHGAATSALRPIFDDPSGWIARANTQS